MSNLLLLLTSLSTGKLRFLHQQMILKQFSLINKQVISKSILVCFKELLIIHLFINIQFHYNGTKLSRFVLNESLEVSTVNTNRDWDQDFSIVKMPFFKLSRFFWQSRCQFLKSTDRESQFRSQQKLRPTFESCRDQLWKCQDQEPRSRPHWDKSKPQA